MPKDALPIEPGQWLWVLTKVTRVSDEPNDLGVREVTVQMPNGYLETLIYNPDKMHEDADTRTK